MGIKIKKFKTLEMKKIQRLLFAFLAVSFMVSCEEEDNLDPVGEWELTDPLLLSSEEALMLDESNPTENIDFSWDPAVSSERYQVRYNLVIDTIGSENYSTPILSKPSRNGGRETTASFTASEIDLALSYAGFNAGTEADVEVAVVATSIDKETRDVQNFTIERFETEYKPQQLFLTGAATESGADLSQAISMRALNDANGNPTYQFEAYTHLEAGQNFRFFSRQQLPSHMYGGSDGQIVKNGDPITIDESGEYRLTVDLEENTYDLVRIERLSIVGDVIPGGWEGDEALDYAGNGVWQGQMSLQVKESGQGGFLIRLNQDWSYLFKRIVGTQEQLYMESQAESAGISIEDIPLTMAGNYTITVDLSGESYTYSLEREQVSNPPSETPDELYLLSNGETVATFTKDEGVFRSEAYIALQADVPYQLNSAEDGSGTAYSLNGIIGDTSNPDGDSAAGSVALLETNDDIMVARDQAYQLNLDFGSANASWKYYNIKLFHWSNWDDRDEFLMTYVHPYQFTTTQDLEAGYEMKFNSPWDIQFGADDPSAMSGTMTNAEDSANFVNITASGTYEVNIQISEDYQTGTYEFIKE